MSRIQETLMSIGTIGKNTDGSITRACFSQEYFAAVGAVKEEMAELGMAVSVDQVGNVHGYLSGTDTQSKRLIMGSHLDTVPGGGIFDGAYGVCAAIEVVRSLKEMGKNLRHPLEIWGFNAEESNPIGGTFGSRAITGLVDLEQPGLAEGLALYGRTAQDVRECRQDFSDAECYLELHIEQGDRLYNEGLQIGVVSGIVGIARYEVTAVGQSNHAGTTMMKNRRDAMVGMSKLIAAADARARELDDTLVLTVGTTEVFPGSENVIPGKVICCFEMRHMETALTDRLIADIRTMAEEIPDVDFIIKRKIEKGAVFCDNQLIRRISAVCEKQKVRHVIMPSGAGHDANPMAHRLPIGMIFVPSRDGISHDKEEWTEAADLENGVQILLQTILELDS